MLGILGRESWKAEAKGVPGTSSTAQAFGAPAEPVSVASRSFVN